MTKTKKVKAPKPEKTPFDLIAEYAKRTRKPPYIVRLEFQEAASSFATADYRHSTQEFN